MRNIKLVSSVLFLLVFLSACQLPFAKQRPAPADVLLASECGQDKLKCCTDEPKCSFGQKCCPDPNDAKRDYCSDECTCGSLDEFCCASQPKCGEGLACSGSFCVKCGLSGGPCCETGEACQSTTGQDGNPVECRAGQCIACGVDGQAVCSGASKCATNHLLNNGICYRCGEINQPCCRNEEGAQNCSNDPDLICNLGFCQAVNK